jgi:beta-glucosidase
MGNHSRRISTLRDIPADFTIGTATSSWQIEGDSAGRGRSIWDDFATVPGAIADGSTADPACDHVRLLEADLDLLAWLGVDAYRFSISWPRVQPGGSGKFSATGMDFYERLIDGLLARGISPMATLYHWDLPSELSAAGGWLSRTTTEHFAAYALDMAERFGDRVDAWATLNEPWVSAYLGYAAGIHAPGIKDPESSLRAAYNLMLGHGRALAAMRTAGARNCGIVLNLVPVIPEDDSPATHQVCQHIDGLHNRFFLDLLSGNGIPTDLRESCSSFTDFGFVDENDAALISAPIDWLGENYYTVSRVAAGGGSVDAVGQDAAVYPGTPACRFAPREPRTTMGWEIYPEGLFLALEMAHDALPNVPLWVTENGAACADEVIDGAVDDPVRLDYLDQHMGVTLAARDAGMDIRGYLAWSLLDNIEWGEGLTQRFGIVHVDHETQVRTPKASAHWLRALLADRPTP